MNKVLFVVMGLLTLPAYALTANTGGATIGGGVQLGCECPDGTFVAFGATCPNGSTCVSGGGIGTEPGVPIINNCSAATCKSSDWKALNSKYQSRTSRWCYNDECISRIEYRCGPMYWGVSTDGETGCEFCPPTYNSATAYSVPGENEERTDCYSPKGEFQDSSGIGTFLADCYFVE